MSINRITNETSIKDRPMLRMGLLVLWVVTASYTLTVLGMIFVPKVSGLLNISLTQAIVGIPALLQVVFEFGVDFLIFAGFFLIGGFLLSRRSDDWFAIFTSIFLITFGARVTNHVSILAMTPGYEIGAGLVLALGDIGVVMFMMLFPDGKFTPNWLKFAVPVLIIMALGIYVIPSAPFFWAKMDQNVYLAITSGWYIFSFWVASYRYSSRATLAQKQQMRWVFIGAMGPFFWYIIFRTSLIFIPALGQPTMLGAAFQTIAHLLGIVMFLLLPISIIVSIVRSKLFDIDLLINRSLVYGTLTIGLVLFFAAMLGIVSLIFQHFHQGDQSLLAATIFSVAAGALFQPVRKRLQRFVDRVFYKINIDYQKTPAEIRRDESSTGITALSDYTELKLIARGGMAEIYRANSPTNGKPVAIKILPATLATDDQFRRRFMREAEIVSRLEHTNIVHINDFGDENGTYFIVMEYLSGPDLSKLLKEQKRITLPEALTLLRDVGAALDYAHQRGLVHRDIKPSNVMMDTSTGAPRAVLTDFGIAKITDAHTRITATGVLGTFDYIAPEQIQASAEVDHHADLYALGVMTYQMLTGRLPFERPNTGALLLAHISAPPPDVRELMPDIPRYAAYALQRVMSKKPKDRYTSAAEFVAALESA